MEDAWETARIIGGKSGHSGWVVIQEAGGGTRENSNKSMLKRGQEVRVWERECWRVAVVVKSGSGARAREWTGMEVS